MNRVLSAAPLLIALAACSSDPRLGEGPETTVVQVKTDLPPPMADDVVTSGTPFLIGPYDKIDIRVFGVQDLSGEVVADGSGRVSVPLLGEVDASGKTPGQLAARIADGLRGRYVRNPQVTVNVIESKTQTFTVDGQVGEPGIYPVVGNMSLMRAIATAKGGTEFARLDDVVVFRKVNGRSMAALYNLAAIRRGLYGDPKIYANDIVVVGDDRSRRLFKDLIATIPSLATPLVILLQR